MCAAQNKGALFMECALNFKKQRHTFIDCIPLPWELCDEAPMYFKVLGYEPWHLSVLTCGTVECDYGLGG